MKRVLWRSLAVIALEAMISPVSSSAENEPEPLRLPIPAEKLGNKPNDYYGLYVLGAKTGWASISTRSREKEIEWQFTLFTHFKSENGVIELKVTSTERFDKRPPHRFLGGSQISTQGPFQAKMIYEAIAPAHFQVTTQAGDRTLKALVENVDYTLSDILTPELWFANPRTPGESVLVRTFDMEEQKSDLETYHITGRGSSVVDGVKVEYYECEFSTESGISRVPARIGIDGTFLSLSLGENMEIRLEPKWIAQDLSKPIDLFTESLVKCDRSLGDPSNIEQLVVEIRGKGVAALPDDALQDAEFDAERDLATVRLGKRFGKPVEATDEDLADALQANAAYPAQDPKINALAREAVGSATTPREQVERLTSFVSDLIEDDYNAEPLTVHDLLSIRRGDCTEHTALFVTLCRSIGIPCRSVGGIAYIDDETQAFGGHAWAEVVIDGHWHPVDPTWDEVDPSATHIRYGHGETDVDSLTLSTSKLSIKVLEVIRSE